MRVRVTIELDVDPDAWVAAALESESLVDGEDANDPTDLLAVADAATSYYTEDNRPRWARDSVSIICQSLSINEPS